STGAQNDIQRVTDIARSMVTKYGMSDKIGPMALGNGDEEVFLGRDIGSRPTYSEKVASEIDNEVKRIVHEGYERAEQLLSDNIDKLHTVAEALLKLETLDADKYKRIFNGEIIIKEEDTMEEIQEELKKLKAKEEAIKKENKDKIEIKEDQENQENDNEDNSIEE
ncbi:MAG: zinc metalloprotease, partial [Tissierellia bacterium]|nr:zinc metalloprotease [Tissierellia bacterium]